MNKTIELISALLKAKLSGVIKSFYIGDPLLLPDSSMPCISVSPENSNINIADNQRDVRTHRIQISLIIDARKYFNALPGEMVGTTFLLETMSKELADGSIDPNTILGVIRDNLTIASDKFVSNEVTIDYTTRRRTEDLITLEAIMTIEIQHISNR